MLYFVLGKANPSGPCLEQWCSQMQRPGLGFCFWCGLLWMPSGFLPCSLNLKPHQGDRREPYKHHIGTNHRTPNQGIKFRKKKLTIENAIGLIIGTLQKPRQSIGNLETPLRWSQGTSQTTQATNQEIQLTSPYIKHAPRHANIHPDMPQVMRTHACRNAPGHAIQTTGFYLPTWFQGQYRLPQGDPVGSLTNTIGTNHRTPH
jgi:hypothetical protein